MAVSGFRPVKATDKLKTSDESAILSASTKAGGDGVVKIAELDISLYSPVSADITTNNVVITAERIVHIQERHPGDWEKYRQFIGISVTDPDFILKDNNPDTAICIKQIYVEDEIKHIRTTLRLHTKNDADGRENSVLTFQKINKKEFRRLSRNEKVVYRRE